jgi:hypothetical protein
MEWAKSVEIDPGLWRYTHKEELSTPFEKAMGLKRALDIGNLSLGYSILLAPAKYTPLHYKYTIIQYHNYIYLM